ncbi:hypothetical protein [Sphingomonas morindae]|uniref:Uncharacterized protein n=1 Tax=Sphingomonas morindae TaxID=1541170 RepID=A0ABY4X9M4_9SPHN|nr:hypothetical protein [Sphingomonas morindae]USI73642.1 hypothetical protein LHA26_03985 [Sphingomonas morindae]
MARRRPSDRRREEAGRDPALQRIRVGVTGLAAVFLLTLLAAALFAFLGQDPHPAPHHNGGGPANAAAEEAPKEPLAELGVAPGNAPKPSPPIVTLNPAPPAPGSITAVPAAPPAAMAGPPLPAGHAAAPPAGSAAATPAR